MPLEVIISRSKKGGVLGNLVQKQQPSRVIGLTAFTRGAKTQSRKRTKGNLGFPRNVFPYSRDRKNLGAIYETNTQEMVGAKMRTVFAYGT